jgi:hypothetical protein
LLVGASLHLNSASTTAELVLPFLATGRRVPGYAAGRRPV